MPVASRNLREACRGSFPGISIATLTEIIGDHSARKRLARRARPRLFVAAIEFARSWWAQQEACSFSETGFLAMPMLPMESRLKNGNAD